MQFVYPTSVYSNPQILTKMFTILKHLKIPHFLDWSSCVTISLKEKHIGNYL